MSDLFVKTEKQYGSKYKDHYLEQYKLYIESIEKISDRRQNANNYFITINTALISLIGLSIQYRILEGYAWIKAMVAFVGIIICVIFWFLIRSYKQLNTGKFNVLHDIEKQLPLAIYKHEWDILGKGKDNNKYFPFSHVELFVPWAFGIVYVILGLALLCGVSSLPTH
ncbi:MAG TPA: hypothetical protein VMW41_04710 [Candidatus Bathyarchaeia archaeon]|nr:hypothetical protein [Candidatus Bathyarchaeia archaeon]